MKIKCKKCRYKFDLSKQTVEALMDLYKPRFEPLGIKCKSCGNSIEDDLAAALGIKDKIIKVPSYQIVWPDGSVKPTKISINNDHVSIIPESGKRIYGQYCYSPDKKYIAVFEYGLIMNEGIYEKYMPGRVSFFEDKKRCIWQKEFISSSKVFVSNSGDVFVIDSLNTCINESCVDNICLISIKGDTKFSYIFRSNLNKVIFSFKRNELICSTLKPDWSFYLFNLASQKLIHKAKLQKKFQSWFLENIYYSFKADHLNIWNESLFEKIREKIFKEEDLKDLSDNKMLTLKDLEFKSQGLTEEYERSQFIAVYTKPEFKIFEEYEMLKSESEGREFEGTISNFYFDSLKAMGITKLDQLLNIDINILIRRANDKSFPSPGKVYGINDIVVKKLGRTLKGIEDYIPVSENIRKELTKIGINKLGDCMNFSKGELLNVKGVGKIILANIDNTLQKYHCRIFKPN